MGVGKSMKIFFEGMENQFIGGYGPKIVTTPMGPFRWDDNRQLWENVNNGMVLSNISFQDMMMMGYDSLSGDSSNGCSTTKFRTSPTRVINYPTTDSWFFTPTNAYVTTNTCPFIAYVNIENVSTTPLLGFAGLTISDFNFKYKTTLGPDDIDGLTLYANLNLGLTGTNITINPGVTFGIDANGIGEGYETNFNVAVKLNDPEKYGLIRFDVNIYNKTTNKLIHRAGVTLNNMDVIPDISGDLGNLVGLTQSSVTRWSSTSGPQSSLGNASPLNVDDVVPYIVTSLQAVKVTGNGPNLVGIYYSVNNNIAVASPGGLTLASADTLKLAGVFPKKIFDLGITQYAQGNIFLRNTSPGAGNALLAAITWSYEYPAGRTMDIGSNAEIGSIIPGPPWSSIS